MRGIDVDLYGNCALR